MAGVTLRFGGGMPEVGCNDDAMPVEKRERAAKTPDAHEDSGDGISGNRHLYLC